MNDLPTNDDPNLDELNPNSVGNPEGAPIAEKQLLVENEPTPEKLNSLEGLKPAIEQPKDREVSDLDLNSENDKIPEKLLKDMTEEVTELHKLDSQADKITQKADDEEEHFIEEVEKHHGNL